MSDIATACSGLAEPDRELLRNVRRGMSITADLSRSDLLLLCHSHGSTFTVAAQAKPHSIASLYATRLEGQQLSGRDYPAFAEAWHSRRHIRIHRDLLPSGAPVIQDVYPIFGQDGLLIALFSVEISQIQMERHRTRDKSFQRAVDLVKRECMRGELANTANLSPFTEWDGVLLVDLQRRITYLSGIAVDPSAIMAAAF